MKLKFAFTLIALLSTSALAQDRKPATIAVSASGSVETKPDIATLSLTIRGEGRTPDAAVTQLAVKQKAILNGLGSLDPKMDVRTGSISIREVRVGDCENRMVFADSMDAVADRLEAAADAMETSGNTPPAKVPCKVAGRVAEIEVTILLNSVKDAGTAVGLAGRLGAADAKVEAFSLRDDAEASRRAVANAMSKAKAQAEAIAAASGSRLGPIVSVEDTASRENMSMDSMRAFNMAPAAMMAPPIVVDIAPRPVETSARLIVTFSLEK